MSVDNELEALRAENARLRAAGRALLREAEKSGMADNWTAIFDTGPRRNGTPVEQSVKDARRAMNEMRAALEAGQ